MLKTSHAFATIVGNTSADLGEIMLSGEPKKAAIRRFTGCAS